MSTIITDAERLLRLIVETSDAPGAIEIVPGRTKRDAAGAPTSDIELLCWVRSMTDQERRDTPHKRTFLLVDPTRPETIAAALTEARALRDRYGNVYLSRCLYQPDARGKYRRDAALAIPNRLVFVDDVQPEHKADFAIYIETSEGNGQAYKLLDRSLNAVQYGEAAQRLAAHYGGDPSGVDYVQLGRWPNTTNTKGYAGTEGYRVRMTRYAPEQGETLESIRARYPLPERQLGSTHAARQCAAAPGDWRGLPDGAALIASGRYQWMCENRPQINMLLVTHERVTTYRETGQVDTTDSAQRAALASNLLQLHKPPPLAEIRAVALALKPHIGADLTDMQYRTAIDREIATYLHIHYTAKGKAYRPSPTTGIKATPAAPRPRGRAYAPAQTRAAQLNRLRAILRELPTNDYGAITPDAAALAAQLGKSPKMIRNYLHDMAAQKEIKWAASGKGHKLALILTNRFGMPNEPTSEKEIKSAPAAPISAPVLPSATLETPIAATPPLESTGNNQGAYVLTQAREAVSDCQPADAAPEQAPAAALPPGAGPWPAIWHAQDADYQIDVLGVAGVWLDGQVYVAVVGSGTGIPLAEIEFVQPKPPARPRLADAVRAVFDQLHVDQETGERKRVYGKHVREALAALGTWPDAAIDRAIDEERTRRRCAAIVADIRQMQPATLRAQLRLMERLTDKSHEQGTNLYKYTAWAARELRAELARRPAAPGRKSRKNCEALPDLRTVGEHEQAELWAAAEQALAELRASQPARQGIRARLFTHEAQPAVQAFKVAV